MMAERVGFEPTKGFHPCWFSRPVHSTALPPLRVLSSNCASIGGRRQSGSGRTITVSATGTISEIGSPADSAWSRIACSLLAW